MKPKNKTQLFFRNLTFPFAALAIAPSAFSASASWDGGASTTDLNTAVNWNPDTAVPGAANGDTATWNGAQAGVLSLTWSANIGANSGNSGGMNLSLTGTQTNSLTLDGAAGAIGLGNITIASGAGAFTLGDGAGTSTVNLRGTGTFTNNSTNTATLGADVRFGNGNATANRNLNFGGSGNWLVNTVITSATYTSNIGTLSITRSGTGTLTMAGANTGYGGGTTIGINGTGTRTGVVRAAATQALGSGTVLVGNGGNDTTARLELTDGISLNNAITLPGRNNTTVSILNVGGNNTLSGVISITSGGSAYIVQSDADTLTLSNSVTNTGGSRILTLQGAGSGLVSGVISNGGGTTAVTKDGSGIWTLSNTNGYTGATGVIAGKLVVDGNISTSISTTVSGTGTLAGSGAVGNLVAQSGGTVAPGNSIESLAAGNVSFESASTYAYELNTVSLNGDLLDSGGTLDITSGAVLTLNQLASATRSLGDKLTLISYTGSWNKGLFTYLGNTLADDSTFTLGSNVWQFNYNDLSGGSNFTSDQTGATGFVTMTVVPEPAAALLGSLGMLALLRRRR